MNTLRIAQAALATILALGVSSNTHAFMADAAEESADVQVNLTEMVNSLQEEIDAGETSCEDMLAKLDAALEDIDARLDAGVSNEAEYLEARDAVAKMRYDLECLAKELALDLGMPVPSAGPVAPLATPVSGGCPTCGGGGLAGGGGSAGPVGGGGPAGGGAFGNVGAAAAFSAIIAIPFAFDSNDGPGFVASLSN